MIVRELLFRSVARFFQKESIECFFGGKGAKGRENNQVL